MGNEQFQHEYDLTALTMVRPRGHCFSMWVGPRYRSHYENQEYERYTARLLAAVLSRCSLFVDVGANFGFYTLLARTLHPRLAVIALEPVTETFEVLKRNAQTAGLQEVRLENAAATDNDGTATLFISKAADNCSFYPHPVAPPLRKAQVRAVRLDTLLAEREPCPILIKIDVEGHELAVLGGMHETLARFPDLTLVLELNPKMLRAAGTTPEILIGELDRLGFSVFLLDDDRCRPFRLTNRSDWRARLENLGYANLYCVRKEKALSVCFFSHSSALAGAERSLIELVKELTADYGAVCSVVMPGEGPLVQEAERVGAACVPAEYGWWGVMPPAHAEPLASLGADLEQLLKQVLPAISEIDPDVIWTQSLVIPWGAVAAALIGKPHVWSVCEYGELDYDMRFFAPFSRILSDVLASSALVYTAGKDLGRTLFPTISPERWRVLYRAIEVPEAPTEDMADGLFRCPGAFRVGMFGTLHEGKGQSEAIAAIAELSAENRNLELLLAGYAPASERARLESLIASQHLQDRVRIPGFLDDRFAAMRCCDVILVCSRREAFGRTASEAMLLGKPVVYAASGGMLEYLSHGQTGISYPPGDVKALAAALRMLMDNPARAAELRAAAQAEARVRFSRQAYGGEVYKRLLELREKRLGGGPVPSLLQELTAATLVRTVKQEQKLRKSLRERTAEGQRLEAALRERVAEAEGLRLELERYHARFKRLIGLEKFCAKQKRSLRKRQAELRDLLLRAAVGLGCTPRLRRLNRERILIRASKIFDSAWYLNKYPHLTSSRTDPVLHYLCRGAAEGCDPNQLFDTMWYLDRNPEVAAAGLNPLVHYLETVWQDGRQPSAHFDPRLYLEANPDVASARIEPLSHYLHVGRKEERALEPGAKQSFSYEPETSDGCPVPDVRLVAFYLPQFHRIPENDTWWGEGFTEWTNVRRGRPQFRDHYQPHVPHPLLGYYDLNDESVLESQAQMARRFGLHGFCFHHYWFGGRRLLEMPVERLLRTGKPDFPFCLCWANENWTRRWDGSEKELLLAQQHSPEDDERFIRDLLRAFADRRYIRVEGRPVLLIYRPSILPQPAETFARWRRICRAEGVGEIFLLGAQSFDFSDPNSVGLDGAVEFPPHKTGVTPLPPGYFDAVPEFEGLIFDYSEAQWSMLKKRTRDYRLFRGIIPSWDNTARLREQGTIFVNATPQNYYLWLSRLIRETRERFAGDERLIFVNAWNEWAEGCHLEPDQRHGFAWLNATRRALLPPDHFAPARHTTRAPSEIAVPEFAAKPGRELAVPQGFHT